MQVVKEELYSTYKNMHIELQGGLK